MGGSNRLLGKFRVFCSWLAQEKGRDAQPWLLLGFLFGFIALLTLVGAPALEYEEDDDEDKRRALRAGADDYMVGPVERTTILDRVMALQA